MLWSASIVVKIEGEPVMTYVVWDDPAEETRMISMEAQTSNPNRGHVREPHFRP